MIAPFSIARLPRIEFGNDSLGKVPALAVAYGKHALLVTGANSLETTAHWPSLLKGLEQAGLHWDQIRVLDEPSPRLVDDAVAQHKDSGIDVVIGIGGGSVLDAAKAIAGLLPHGNPVLDHLEGVGPELPYSGPATPFIAVPTTAGTGSEATKNAVLSQRGKQGFKKSFRHEALVPDYAVVDPALLASCPPALIAANGMDAFTQLLESYMSLRANAYTDALALSGLKTASEGLLAWYDNATDAAACSKMAYAALLSGITLAQCGLGSVHGLASPLGAMFPIPHGVVCGTLVAACSEININAMRKREADNPALKKYADVAALINDKHYNDVHEAWSALLETLKQWTERMQLPRLSTYGIKQSDFDDIIANSRGSSMKTNPIILTDGEIKTILEMRL